MTARGLVIAAPRSGGGKTTLTLGLMRAFRLQGLRVAGLKCGPDYIDPAFHEVATGRKSFNVDSWAMQPNLIRALAAAATEDADILLCEGLMGLFDGVPGEVGHTGATADIAAAFSWPVLLVLDVSGQSQSAGAIALGCAHFDPRIRIGGVVLNRIGSTRHERLATAAIESAGLKVLGALPRETEIVLPERHLGLVQAAETRGLDSLLEKLGKFVAANVDLEKIIGAAKENNNVKSIAMIKPPGQRIAVAYDEAFSFLYPHLAETWRQSGAELVLFSPLADEAPPADCDMCWLPGGYPELHAERIAHATNFLAGVRRFATSKPVHGECGGYMVLGKAIIDAEGRGHRMLGLLDLVTSFAKRRMTLGYREALLLSDCALGHRGSRWRGHEFHYATILETGEDAPFAQLSDAYGSEPTLAGGRRGCVTGSFFHLIAPTASPHESV